MLCNGQKYNNLFLEELIAHSQPKTSRLVLNKNKPTWLFVSCEIFWADLGPILV